MGNNLRHIRGQAQKELVKKFDAFFNKGYSRWEVWSDWVTLSAIAISNATDASHAEQREAQYRTISKKYTKPDIAAISQVASNMAAERGVKRVPLAVLSQSEISRRMKAI